MPKSKNSTYAINESGQNPKKSTSKTHKKLTAMKPLVIGTSMLVALDQWTKALVIENIPFLGTWLPDKLIAFEKYFRIVHWRNSGAAFGMFANGNTIFLILAIIVSVFIMAYYPLVDNQDRFLRLALILQLGGALGNMIDRIKFGYVIDFISVRNFPVFNIADSLISIGVVVLLGGVIHQEIKDRKAKQQADTLYSQPPHNKTIK